MNSELEKLIEKYRITVNGLADLESDYEKIIKERGFVTLNGLLVESDSPSGEGTGAHSPSGESTVNTENTPVAESDTSHNELAPVVPAAPAPSEPAVENAGVTPVPSEPAVSDDTNLGTEVASGESAEAHSPSGERSAEPVADAEENASGEEGDTEGDDTASTDEPATGGKPKKKRK